MRQFDVYSAPGDARAVATHLVLLSSHHLQLDAVLVAPLLRATTVVRAAEVAIRFDDEERVISLIDMAAVDPRRLRGRVGSLAQYEDVITRALQRLFTGF